MQLKRNWKRKTFYSSAHLLPCKSSSWKLAGEPRQSELSSWNVFCRSWWRICDGDKKWMATKMRWDQCWWYVVAHLAWLPSVSCANENDADNKTTGIYLSLYWIFKRILWKVNNFLSYFKLNFLKFPTSSNFFLQY